MKTFSELKEALDQSNLSDGKTAASNLFGQTYSAIIMMHFFHLTTPSYAAHIAANEFYTGMQGLLDSVIENFQGKYGKLETMPKFKIVATDGLAVSINLSQAITQLRSSIGDDSEIQNLIDNMVSLCNSTTYKLRELK